MITPFTLEDAENKKSCLECKHADNCAIIVYANTLSQKRDNKDITDSFNCISWEEDDMVLYRLS